MLLTVFAADPPIPVSAMPARLAALRIAPLTLRDAADVLLSAFVEKHTPVLEYLRREGVASEENPAATRKATLQELRTLAEEVAVRCLTHEGKGKTLKRLCDAYPTVRGRIIQAVLGEHQVKVEDLGEPEEGAEPGRARLARQMGGIVVCEEEGSESEWEGGGEDEDEDRYDFGEDVEMESVSGESEWSGVADANAVKAHLHAHELGSIGLESLSAMIRRDEMHGGRGRRRYIPMIYGATSGQSSRLPLGDFFYPPFLGVSSG
jgi:hypothetical protein